MPRLGDLERAVMEALWSAAAPMTAREVVEALGERDLAVTTVLTVLSRLERKGVVGRRRDGRAHTYRATASREDHVAQLMREALGGASDREAALVRFVSAASPEETDALRRALRAMGRRSGRS
jgi:predicted transcriptional regulator